VTIRRGVPLLDQEQPVLSGTLANRPAAGTVAAGTGYYATDNGLVYEQVAGAWVTAPYSTIGVSDVPDLSATYQVRSEKNANSGYCGLDSGGDVASGQLGNAVESLKKSGDTALHGAVTLSEGANITLTQSGQDIAIESTGGGGGGGTATAGVNRTTDQTITTSTVTPLSFDTEDWDTDTMFDAGTPTRFTIVTAGRYLLSGFFRWNNNVSGVREAMLRLNGSTRLEEHFQAPVSGEAGHVIAMVAELVATDYVELCAYHTRGSNLNVDAAVAVPRFTASQVV
jgi:hypothetical protein